MELSSFLATLPDMLYQSVAWTSPAPSLAMDDEQALGLAPSVLFVPDRGELDRATMGPLQYRVSLPVEAFLLEPQGPLVYSHAQDLIRGLSSLHGPGIVTVNVTSIETVTGEGLTLVTVGFTVEAQLLIQ